MALSTQRNDGNNASQFASGSFSGTYTAADFTITLGFAPRYFRIINLTDRVTNEWFEGMNAGDYLKTAANGDRTLETDDSIVVNIAGTGSQDGSQGTVDATYLGVVNNVSYPGPATITNSTATDLPGIKGAADVTVDISVSGIMTDNDTVVWQAFA